MAIVARALRGRGLAFALACGALLPFLADGRAPEPLHPDPARGGAPAPTLGGGGGGHPRNAEGARASSSDAAEPQGASPFDATSPIRPGPVEPDRFHPDRRPGPEGVRPPMPAPRRGGRVVICLSDRPGSWNPLVDSTSVVRTVHQVIHESLLRRDPETWDFRSRLSTRWAAEDRLRVRLVDASGAEHEETWIGRVSETADGWRVEPAFPGAGTGSSPADLPEELAGALPDGFAGALPEGPRTLPRDALLERERATVFTFELRPDVLWHDGHPFGVNDVLFSWRAYQNPTIDCEHDRGEVNAFTQAYALDERTVRFVADEPYFGLYQALENLVLLPAHLYDLTDPDNPDYDAALDPADAWRGERQGRYVNTHPANRRFVGLGPYALRTVEENELAAVRFDGYFDPDPKGGRAGWLDAIRWRLITDRQAARTALLQGELDYFEGLTSSDYFGEFTHAETFTDRFYAGFAYRPTMQYIAWNMRRPHLADGRVRSALAAACDWQAFLDGTAHGLGARVTGTAYRAHPGYDADLTPVPYDPARAAELLDEAGWYDRDGDGVRDKDGRPLLIEFLVDAGGGVDSLYARSLQEALVKIGVRLEIQPLDSVTLYERLRAKDFDAVARAWFLDPENDPGQLWSRQARPGEADRSTNYPGWGTAESDALIERIRRTVDDEERWALERELQRWIFRDQPYLFLFDFPSKFAVARRVRGVRLYGLQPGYSPTDWFVVEDR